MFGLDVCLHRNKIVAKVKTAGSAFGAPPQSSGYARFRMPYPWVSLERQKMIALRYAQQLYHVHGMVAGDLVARAVLAWSPVEPFRAVESKRYNKFGFVGRVSFHLQCMVAWIFACIVTELQYLLHAKQKTCFVGSSVLPPAVHGGLDVLPASQH